MKTIPFDLKAFYPKSLLALVVLLFHSVLSQAQTIQGVVLEKETNKPIAKASIYFDGMYRGTVSDNEGNFILDISKVNKNIPLTISAVGFTSETVSDYQQSNLKIFLKPKVVELTEVVIGFDRMSREEKLKIFRAQFLGSSANSKQCEILNEDDLQITYSKKTNTIKASSEKPLMVSNKNLAYKITYFLDDFSCSGDEVSFRGNYYFEEDTIHNKKDEIRKRREKAYAGSRMHFIRSLWNNQLSENKFRVYGKSNAVLKYEDLVVENRSGKYIHLPGNVRIEFSNYYKSVILKKASSIFIDQNGFYDPLGIIWSGAISAQRIGDLLPFEFVSSKEKNQSVPKPIFANEIQKISAALDSFTTTFSAEKIYVHTDKPYYSIGDTLWFKSYLFDTKTGGYSPKSGLLYVELITDSAAVAQRICVPINLGLSIGQFILNDAMPEGAYTLRAYTNWMQNFGQETFFTKRFYLASNNPHQWLVTESHKKLTEEGKTKITFDLLFRKQNGQQIGFKTLQWRVLQGRKSLTRNTTETLDGHIKGSFLISDNTNKNLSLVVQDKADPNQKAILPIHLAKEDDIDLQFMPEGGHLVAEVPGRVAFKALYPNGKGADVKGIIIDSKNNEVTTFESQHNGMGTFELTPSNNEKYVAKVKFESGTEKEYAIPNAQASGIVLRVSNKPTSDSIIITILLSADLVNEKTYHLTGFSNGRTLYGATFVANKQRVRGLLSKHTFPTGIAHFTVFDDKNQAITERIAFIDHKDDIEIKLTSNKSAYKLRDSVSLSVESLNKDGLPVAGSFSMAVTDDSLVNTDTLDENLLSHFYLSSDLKGKIENPAFYFTRTPEAYQALDLIMLTQGWIGYNWADIFKPTHQPVFAAEKSLTVSGKILNAFNKPVSNSNVLLLSKGKVTFLRDTLTNSDGRFTFTNFPSVDTVSFFVQARNARGKSFNVGIEMDQFRPATTQIENHQPLTPWYVNSDSTVLNLIRKKNDLRLQKERILGKNVLKDVVITAKRTIRNSKNLNGPGEADQILDEEQIQKTGDVSVIDLLSKQVRGFGIRTDKTGDQYFFVNDKRARFVVDGFDLNRFYEPSEPRIYNEFYQYILSSLSSLSASEITGIEVMYNNRFTGSYNSEFLTIEELRKNPNVAYLEITTRSGKGVFFKNRPGIATYKPLPITYAKEFYKPKYTSKSNLTLKDYRSTIHWQPHLFVNETGKASTSFYTADKPGTYTIIILGSNMEGLVGYKMMKLKIEEDSGLEKKTIPAK